MVEPRSDPPGLDPIAAWRPLLASLAGLPAVDAGSSRLVDQAVELRARPGFDSFACLARLRFEPFEHQLAAAAAVLRRLRGRAILADEVGLGKTIEAGLVLSELRVRGMAQRCLVVVPAGLVGQWREELDRKFALPSVVAGGGVLPPAGGDAPVVIASLASARRSPLADSLAAEAWDLVVCDEAHRLRNPRNASGRLARSLRARHLLLLTATPVENRLDDLFQLVSLVSPGLLGTAGEFRRRHASAGGGPPANVADLQRRLRDVMVRHRRSEVKLALPRRLAETLRLTPHADEAGLYRAVSDRVRAEGRQAPPSRLMALQAAQRVAGSGPQAMAGPLAKLGWDDLVAAASGVGPTSKDAALMALLDQHVAAGDKVVVFTSFLATLAHLRRLVDERGIDAAVYHGGLSRADKDAAIARFEDDAPVLLTTDAAGEGRNLQFCHVMVNVDLPWNPMQIEQRLGRLHRIGQRHDVVLTNLVSRGTIEDRILAVLEARINLFELVVGELDMILGRVDDDFDLETHVFRAHVQASDDEQFDARLGELGDRLAHVRAEHLEGVARIDELVGTDEP
ncbi:MAG: DEAD/DEAH box helicase [Acidimicrobiales bacterium]